MTTKHTSDRRRVHSVVSRLAEVVADGPQAICYGEKVDGSREAHDVFAQILASRPTEEFWELLLDGKHRVIGASQVSVGTLTTSLVHPREVFGPAIRMGAAAVIIAHNHPSGDPEPSSEDREVTARLVEAGRLLGIPVLDHIIVGEKGYASLRETMVIQ